MMDGPSLGLAPLIVKEMFDLIKKIHDEGITIILVEQNAKVVLQIADYGYVLEAGTVKLEGTGKDLAENENVKKAYFGEQK